MNFDIPIPVWNTLVTVMQDRDRYNKWRAHHGGKPMAPGVKAQCTYFEGNDGVEYCVMFFPENPRPGMVAHECFHAAGYILEARGVEASFKNDEPMAYLIDYLVTKVTEKLWSRRNYAASKGPKRSSKKRSSRT